MSYYWGEIPQDKARQIVEVAKRIGYQNAANFLGVNRLNEYILAYDRADWLFDCLNLKGRDKALDIGSGWGANSISLSYQFDDVYSLELVKERLEFQKVRAKQEGRTNIKFIQSDWLTLPFPDNFFDLVVVNGVLEWIGLSDFNKNPKELQIKFLQEVKRVLKPGGVLYIGIENRFAFFFFFGAIDHSGLPFTSLMPRRLASVLVRKFRNTGGKYEDTKRMGLDWSDYRTYTYSYWGYQNIMKEAGFFGFKIYWTLNYNSPSEAGPMDGESFSFLLNFLRMHDFSVTITSKIATKLALLFRPRLLRVFFPIFAPSFLIYANKEGGSKKDLFESRVLSLGKKQTSFLRRSGTHGLTSKINYFLLENGQAKSVVKFARFSQFQESLVREEALVAKWNGMNIKKTKVGDRDVFLEPYLKGHTCRSLSLEDNELAVSWLLEFQTKTESGLVDSRIFEKEMSNAVGFLRSQNFTDKVEKIVASDLALFTKKMGETKIKKVASHGDFVKTNIIIDNKKIYVIDWEFFEKEKDPFFDFIFFIINNSRRESWDYFRENLKGVGVYSKIMKTIWGYFCDTKKINKDLLAESISFVMLKALMRRFIDKDSRHMDISPYKDMVNIWSEISKESKFWLTR
ncbi:hypothetical protein A3D84_05225 [Candidatus Woesebacteria bacterium RIFCSPHIGHO2_02_FULL_42_20]|uniref:Methyltransferase type 11 domain-containing protein n=1 Tax=Candidatus Woesebacteria bacterium RIFCSPHIGHO2_12_FULL_41_24 TaxID=1802510 RepID=A0A1F8AQA2_9BACT|nr:MAG: hypothetical protein A2W15_04785 [Candidatus Woesebacteria bacterium RBG_16_41_13]OGM30614.1 MAG: hypothetical protein A2873_00680 [Candidatus Woesebacteria bacterium RIFCSPHIGHO2_01_FULL_42_80]OGM34592.1 MAG: hypothetical protein A3D84_05225 [Candidatus Woesebacteria bacterium RIFCSPHIGHO2_02_FULL_42_20]OGM53810.1 MAG: hypothetical protein A3E44_05330 [Candidatus Woesebacteria bacterium RIFCSPHIGHO2_12_FULL_41_24]OGM66002.1 MAG: hypothetical protein A2969_03425 [Candidatus Woesebacteri